MKKTHIKEAYDFICIPALQCAPVRVRDHQSMDRLSCPAQSCKMLPDPPPLSIAESFRDSKTVAFTLSSVCVDGGMLRGFLARRRSA